MLFPEGSRRFWRCHPDLNRGIKVLQTLALPLGYGTVCRSIMLKNVVFVKYGSIYYNTSYETDMDNNEMGTSKTVY